MFKKIRKICFISFFLIFHSIAVFSQTTSSENLVILVQANNTDSSFSKSERDFFTLAISKFNEDITMVPEIHVLTDDINSSLLAIQKKSQIDAVQGLASEDSTYATDKGSKAKLTIKLELKSINGKYNVICTVSNIETKNSFQLTSDASELSKIYEEPIDALAYKTLERLSKKNYISDVSYDIKNQLLHEEDTEENNEKYIAEYTKQSEEYQKQIDDLNKQSQNAEEKSLAESEKRALQLKLEMTEKRKQQAEEQIRQQQAEKAIQEKQDAERKNMKSKERDEFNKKIKELEEKKKEILSKSLGSISLQKRIELIETDKQSLQYLQNQLEQSVTESNTFFSEQCNSEVETINNEEWRKADLSQGEPTKQAKQFRAQKIQNVKDKYAKLKINSESDLRASIKPKLDSYESQVNENIAELEKTTYVFRSVDNSDDFLSLDIDAFDGEDKSWKLYSDFSMSTIAKIDTSEIILPDMKISYKTMTGKDAPAGNDEASYTEYQDLVDKADLYFRASVPYLYSEIAIKVDYEEARDKYLAEAQYFNIKKTEDGTVLFSKSEGDLAKLIKEGKQRKQTEEYQKEKKIREQSKAEKQQAAREKSVATKKTLKEKFLNSQNGRTGIYFNGAVFGSPVYGGLESALSFYYGKRFAFSGFEIWASNNFFSDGASVSIDSSSPSNTLVDMQYVYGTAVKLGFFRPYALAGVGLGLLSTYSNDSSDTEFLAVGLTSQVAVGSDIIIKSFTLGTFYRVKWFYQLGFADSFGISLGWTF